MDNAHNTNMPKECAEQVFHLTQTYVPIGMIGYCHFIWYFAI